MIVDLTHVIEEEMPVFPGTEQPILNPQLTMDKDGFREKLLTMFSHTGTHMDAPSHMLEEGKNLDDFDVDHFVGRALVIDCRMFKQEIPLAYIEHYDYDEVDYVLLQTGWDKKWGQTTYFDAFPALSEEAAYFLSEQNLKGLGVDCISVDLMSNHEFTVHKILLSQNMVMIENLKGLDEMPIEFMLYVLPLKIKTADGSPIRAIGIK